MTNPQMAQMSADVFGWINFICTNLCNLRTISK